MRIEFTPGLMPEVKLTAETDTEDYALRHISDTLMSPGIQLRWLHRKALDGNPGYMTFYALEDPGDGPLSTTSHD